jgi:ankyrin repeat protein
MNISVYSNPDKATTELQFIKAINEKVKETGGWEFINEDGWKTGRDKSNNIVISKESSGTPQTTTLLSLAVINNWSNAVKLIIDNGGNINAPDNEGESPLHKASYLGFNNIADYLIKKKSNVNAANRDGMTPLHLTVFFTRYKTAEILLKNGADINAVNNGGETPLFVLKNYVMTHDDNYNKMLRLFTNRGGTDKKGKPSKSENKKTENTQTEAGKFIEEGILKHKAGKYEEAVKLYMRAKRISIGNTELSSAAYFHSAESKIELKDYSSALNDVDMAIYLNGANCGYYQLRMKINKKSGNDKEAKSDIEELKNLKCGKP